MRYAALSLLVVCACTKADIYTTGQEATAPDRLVLSGQLCTDDTGGSRFPVKILLMVDTSQRMFEVDQNDARFTNPMTGLNAFLQRYAAQPHVRFGFVALGDQIQAVPTAGGQTFYRANDPAVPQALAALRTPSGNTRDLVGALAEAESFIQADVDASGAGAVLRTRYLVYLLLSGPPVPDVDAATLSTRVQHLRELVYSKGALEFRLDVGLAYYGPMSVLPSGGGGYGCFAAAPGAPPCACAAPPVTEYCRAECDVTNGYATQAQNDLARTLYEGAAVVGDGAYNQFPCAASIGIAVDVTAGKVHLVRKDVVAFNRNERLTASGPAVDSDGDGLLDSEELALPHPTDPYNWDTDGDGICDGIELRASPRQDPLNPHDRPVNCADPSISNGIPDTDLDLLNDCEEGILSTSPTIPDTDGDGLPDALEYFGGTVPTDAGDRMLDFDADGIPNGVEVVAHTNPRINEGGLAAEYGNRTRVVYTGEQNVAVMDDPDELPGVAFRAASPTVVGGQAYLRWDPCASTLEWSDARMNLSPAYVPVPVKVTESGVYKLTAELWVVDRTGVNRLVDAIWVDVFVTLPLMPSCSQAPQITATPLISVSLRTCYDVTIGNIKLVPTHASNGEVGDGINHVLVFFTQAPDDRLSSPGITKIAEVKVRLRCTNNDDPTTCARSPADNPVILYDRDFVSVQP